MPELEKGDYALAECGNLLVEIRKIEDSGRYICKVISGFKRGEVMEFHFGELFSINKFNSEFSSND